MTGCFVGKIYVKDRFLRSGRTSAPQLPDPAAIPRKDIFYIIDRACPTNGSDCGSFYSHNLTLFVMSALPKHKVIAKRGEFEYKINLKTIIEKEESLFDQMVSKNDFNGLISRYPVRETPVLSNIASGLGLTREKYESAVRKLIIDEIETMKFLKDLLGKLTELIDKE